MHLKVYFKSMFISVMTLDGEQQMASAMVLNECPCRLYILMLTLSSNFKC